MRASFQAGALPLRPRDLTQLRQNGSFSTGRPKPPLSFRPLSRRSGRIPALPYPPLRYFQSGSTAASLSMLLHRTAITPLTSCLTPGVHFRMGGTPMLGYDVDGQSRLQVNEAEAAQVREIFALFVGHGSLEDTLAEMERRGWRRKPWRTRQGKEKGGRAFDRGSLARL